MSRDEYLEMLATAAPTVNQRGRIMDECRRLGLADRAERLAVLAGLLGLDRLGSTADLTMGQAGQLVNALQRVRDRAELPGMQDQDSEGRQDREGGLADDGGGQGGGRAGSGRVTTAVAVQRIILRAYLASRQMEHAIGADDLSALKCAPCARREF